MRSKRRFSSVQEVLRREAAAGRTVLLPLEVGSETMVDIGFRNQWNNRGEYVMSRAPGMMGTTPFPRHFLEGKGSLVRFPSEIDADAAVPDEEAGMGTADEDIEMEDAP